MPPDPLAWGTLDRQVSYTCPGFEVVTESVALPDGTETEYDYVSEPPSVAILAFEATDARRTRVAERSGSTRRCERDRRSGSGREAPAPDAGGEGPADHGDGEETVVCIEEWRQAVSRMSYGVPVGGVEADDGDLAGAARRELAEETGYEAESVEPLVTVEPANGIADSVLHCFVARGCRPTADRDLDENESIRVRPTAFERLREAVREGAVRDGRTVLAVSYYCLAGGEPPADGRFGGAKT